jgi:hypothetical protein
LGISHRNNLAKKLGFFGRAANSFWIRSQTSLGRPSTLKLGNPNFFACKANASRNGNSAAQEVASPISIVNLVTDAAIETPFPSASQKTYSPFKISTPLQHIDGAGVFYLQHRLVVPFKNEQ